MIPPPPPLPESYAQVEGRVIKACESAWLEISPNLSEYARVYRVPPGRLRRRYAGGVSRQEVGGINKRLSEAQDKALCTYLDTLDELGISVRKRMIHGYGNQMLISAHNDPSTPCALLGENWAKRWLKAHPEYVIIKKKPLDKNRKTATNIPEFRAHFDKFRRAIVRFKIHPDDIWNYDETGFRIGVGRAHEVVTRRIMKDLPSWLADPDNRESLTVIECIRVRGEAIPCFVIFALKTLQQNLFLDQVPDDYVYATSETGYSNDELNLEWLDHFEKHTKNKRLGAYRMLISDGYNTHLEHDFLERCWDRMIVPFCLPPHTTHLLQPLDVCCFQPLKHYHAEAIDDAVRSGDTTFTRIEFLAALNKIRTLAFKRNTIKAAFRETGLHPFAPEIVISRLPPALDESTLDWSDIDEEAELVTPMKVSSLTDMADDLDTALAEADAPSPIRALWSKIKKGALAQAHLGTLKQQDLEIIAEKVAGRAKRATGSARRVQKGGVIEVGRGRTRIDLREKSEIEKISKTETKRRNTQKKRQLPMLKEAANVAIERNPLAMTAMQLPRIDN
jgi:DDE superfamily endonuclease/Tc5 transposase DNA-binding domain